MNETNLNIPIKINKNIKLYWWKEWTLIRKELSFDKRFYRYYIEVKDSSTCIFLEDEFTYLK